MSTMKQESIAEANAEETVLEKFINVPGLQHLAENIFLNLNYQDLEACGLVNGSFQHFLDQLKKKPLFLLKKFVHKGMSKKNERDWTEIIQMTRGSNVGEVIVLYLQMYFKNERVEVDFDMPCYIKKDNLEKYSEIIKKVEDGNLSIVSHGYYHDEIVKILDPLTDNPRPQCDLETMSPIYWAAFYEHTEIVKICAPLTEILMLQMKTE